jgi:protein phosphatase
MENNTTETDEHLPASLPSTMMPPRDVSSQVRVDLGARSHQGKVRRNNEDHFLVMRFERALEVLHTNVPAGLVPDRFAEVGYGMLVADGMGGSAAGEIASQVAIRTLVNLVLHTPDWMMRLGEREIEEVMRRFAERYTVVTEALSEHARIDPSLADMGTTMTVAASIGADLVLAHIGDSRAYLWRGGQLHQLTRDHTLAQALVEQGTIRPEEAAKHKLRHVLTRALCASGSPAEPDVKCLSLRDGDQVLLCSDGLTEMVADASLCAVLGAAPSAEEACRALVDLALHGGGRDNVTVVLARYTFPHGVLGSSASEGE